MWMQGIHWLIPNHSVIRPCIHFDCSPSILGCFVNFGQPLSSAKSLFTRSVGRTLRSPVNLLGSDLRCWHHRRREQQNGQSASGGSDRPIFPLVHRGDLAMSERSGGGILSWVGGIIFPLLLVGLGLFAIGNGTYLWWVGHSGIPAQVKILSGCDSPVGSHSATCPASWIQADGTERRVTVFGDNRELSYGKTVDVHIRGDQAAPNSESAWGPAGIPIGIALSGLGVWFLWPTRRRKRDQGPPSSPSDDPGTPQAQIT
jgi:hypothetical protein